MCVVALQWEGGQEYHCDFGAEGDYREDPFQEAFPDPVRVRRNRLAG